MSKLSSLLVIASTLGIMPGLGAAPAQAAGVSFVSGKGVDTGNCSSPASPCRTFQFALGQTSAGGEIRALDSANYFFVTINKSISIIGVDGAGIIRGSVGNAITITAGASDRVNLSNLVLDGFNVATLGVELNSAASLTIDHCIVRNFQVGISLAPTSATRYLIEDTIVSNNNAGDGGIVLTNASGGSLQGALNRVTSRNGFRGLRISAAAKATVSESVFADNSLDGILVGATSPTGGELRLTRSTVTGSINGVRVLAGSLAESAGDNLIRGNGSNVVGTLTNVGTQ